MFYALGEPPASIIADFSSGESIKVHLIGDGRLYASIHGADGNVIRSKAEARAVAIPEIHILPQVSPLLRDEKILVDYYVQANASSTLAPLHFRNQIRVLPEAYSEFVRLSAGTWPGLRIVELVGMNGLPGDVLGLLVNDGTFVAEVAWMGHGLQVWLQMIWFLARTPSDSIVILDEPDVYLHPDLQRRLIKLIRPRFRQIVIATHSIEIMSEVDPSAVLVVDRTRNESRFADDHPAVQRLVDHIGSAHNINLARLRVAKRFVLIEGEDMGILGHFDSLLFPPDHDALADAPHLSIGGWAGWSSAVGSSLALQNYADESITVYCILDPDYHTPTQISDRYEQSENYGIELHIWVRKEIENYLLVPTAIKRVIEKRLALDAIGPTADELSLTLDIITGSLKQEAVDNIGNEFLHQDRKRGFQTASRLAKHVVDEKWDTSDGRWSLVGGKQILSHLSKWCQQTHGVSFGPMAVMREIRSSEIPREVVDVLYAIENARSLQPVRGAHLVRTRID